MRGKRDATIFDRGEGLAIHDVTFKHSRRTICESGKKVAAGVAFFFILRKKWKKGA